MMIPVQAVPANADNRPMPVSTQTQEDRVVLAEINQILRTSSIGLQFEFDPEADEMIAKLHDVESGVVIRQISPENVARISKAICKLQALLTHQTILKKWSESRRRVAYSAAS